MLNFLVEVLVNCLFLLMSNFIVESNGVLIVYRPVAGEMVNQMVSTAVNAANRAAANAYTTCKEVFYTWQARTYQVQSQLNSFVC